VRKSARPQESGNPGYPRAAGAMRAGVTLLELLIVIMIVGLLTAAALKAYDTSLQAGRFRATSRTLNELSAALVGNPDLVTSGVRIDYGYVGDLGMVPDKLQYLMTPPAGIDTGLWHGPYIINRVAENPTGFMRDGWGDSLEYSDANLTISSRRGMSYLQPDSWITRKLARSQNALLNNTVGGWVIDAKGNPPDSAVLPGLSISIAYPLNGHFHSETMATAAIPNGSFTFLPTVPIGNHDIHVRWIQVDTTFAETTHVDKNVSVTPGGKSRVEVHLPVPFR